MGILEIGVLLTAVFWVVSIPFVLILIVAYLVYRKLKIAGLLGYLLILFIGWISGGRDGLLLTNVFLFALIMIAYAIRGLFRSIGGLFDLASEGIRNRKEVIAAAGGSSPTAGGLEEETIAPKVVDQRDHERARPWLEKVPEDSRYTVSTWMPGFDSPIVESFFDRTLMIVQFLELPEGTKVWIKAMPTGKQCGLKVEEGPRLSEAWPSEFDPPGEPSEPEQEESLPSEAYEMKFQLDRMNQIADRAGDAYGGQHVHPDNSLSLAELQKVLHATIWIPESPSPTLETFDTNTAMIRRLMEFPVGTKIWVRWKYSEIGYGLRVGKHGLLSYLNESEFTHFDWHPVHQKHPGADLLLPS